MTRAAEAAHGPRVRTWTRREIIRHVVNDHDAPSFDVLSSGLLRMEDLEAVHERCHEDDR